MFTFKADTKLPVTHAMRLKLILGEHLQQYVEKQHLWYYKIKNQLVSQYVCNQCGRHDKVQVVASNVPSCTSFTRTCNLYKSYTTIAAGQAATTTNKREDTWIRNTTTATTTTTNNHSSQREWWCIPQKKEWTKTLLILPVRVYAQLICCCCYGVWVIATGMPHPLLSGTSIVVRERNAVMFVLMAQQNKSGCLLSVCCIAVLVGRW